LKEQKLLDRDLALDVFSKTAFSCGRFLAELPMLYLPPIVGSGIIYYMIGLFAFLFIFRFKKPLDLLFEN